MPLEKGEVDGPLDVSTGREVEAEADEEPGVQGDEEQGGDGDAGRPAAPDGENDQRSENVDDADAREGRPEFGGARGARA